jgi:hypothetical protein
MEPEGSLSYLAKTRLSDRVTLTFTVKLSCCLYPGFPCNIHLLDSLTRNKRHSHFILSHFLTLITRGKEGRLWRGFVMHFPVTSCGSFLIRITTKKKARLSQGITSCTYRQVHAFQVVIKWSTKGSKPKDPADYFEVRHPRCVSTKSNYKLICIYRQTQLYMRWYAV